MAGILWSADGNVLFSDTLSEWLRFELQPRTKFRNLSDVAENGIGLHRGDTYRWNVYSKIANRGGPIGESQRLPESQFTTSQRSLTIDEFGNSVPLTEKVERLAEPDIKKIIDQTLKDDARKTLDRMCAYQFFQTPLRVAPTGGTSATSVTLTTNSATATTNNVGMNNDHVKAIVDIMKERNIPSYDGDDYVCASHPTTFRPFKNALEDIHVYTDTGVSMIFAGEIGRYESCRFIEQNEIPKGHANDAAFTTHAGGAAAGVNDIYNATDDAWNNAQSSWALFMGADTVMESPSAPEEVRSKLPQDYGRDNGVAWLN